ncbi:hypothetical protein HN604_02025 [archaeon]|nr:hypothetical protein [archaeon]MBT6182676.1 hypothetical protein [archaeon]MBT6606462.1 hypothetical protein [archaeon]MBT7251373.1 hypothetical protein [archaeon]MBT7660840.1 hypothetical protein [archaeon]
MEVRYQKAIEGALRDLARRRNYVEAICFGTKCDSFPDSYLFITNPLGEPTATNFKDELEDLVTDFQEGKIIQTQEINLSLEHLPFGREEIRKFKEIIYNKYPKSTS